MCSNCEQLEKENEALRSWVRFFQDASLVTQTQHAALKASLPDVRKAAIAQHIQRIKEYEREASMLRNACKPDNL